MQVCAHACVRPQSARARSSARGGSAGRDEGNWTDDATEKNKFARKRTAPAAPEKRPAPKMAPSYGPKTGAKKVRADSRPSHFGGQILVHLGGSHFWGRTCGKEACGRREPAGGNSARGGSDSTATHFARWQCKARDADVATRTSHGSPHMRAAALARPEAACLHRHCGTPPLLRKKGVHGRIPRAPGVLSAICLKHTAWAPARGKEARGRKEPAGGNSARGGSDSTPTRFTRWQCKARDADVTIRASH